MFTSSDQDEIRAVYNVLEENGLKCNPRKCFYLSKDGELEGLRGFAEYTDMAKYLGLDLSLERSLTIESTKEKILRAAVTTREIIEEVDKEYQVVLFNAVKGLAIYYLVPLINTAEMELMEMSELMDSIMRIVLGVPEYVESDTLLCLMPSEDPFLWVLRI